MNKKILFTIGVIIMLSIFLTGCFNKKITIENTKRFYFSETLGNYMYGKEIYKLDLDKNKNYIASYTPLGTPEEEALQKKVTTEEVTSIENILSQYKIYSWNGFQKADKHVLDGRDFDLIYEREDGAYISASGYMKYPKGYEGFKKDIKEFYLKLFEEELKDIEDK